MRSKLTFILAGLLAATGARAAAADAIWPQRVVKLVVPFAAGGVTDVIARITAERLAAELKQPFVVENEAGATGTIAALRVARSEPDGYTLFFSATNQISVAPFTHKIAYDPVKDFKPVALIATVPFVIAVAAKVPAATLAELIAHAKANAGKLSYGSSGFGSLSHLAAASFTRTTSIDMPHVMYRGVAPAFQDLLAGHIDMMAATPVELMPHQGTGKVRPLAVMDTIRSAALPDVPLMSDTLPSPSVVTWEAILAPAGTPQPVVNAISDVLTAAGRDPQFIAKLVKVGADPRPMSSEEFAKFLEQDIAKWRTIVTELGIKPGAQ